MSKSYFKIDKKLYYKIIKEWADKNGRSPSKEDFNKDTSLPSPRTLEENLKTSWNTALQELGLEPIKDRSYYLSFNKDKLLDLFKEEYNRIKPKTRKEFNIKRNKVLPGIDYIEEKTGFKWNGLLKTCGFETTKNFYSKEDYKNIILKLAEELGRSPTINEFENAGYTATSLTKKFNKRYNEILEDLGLNINYLKDGETLTKEDLKELYIRLSKELGYPAKSTDINKCKYTPEYTTFTLYFTTMHMLREECGLIEIKERKCKYNKEKILRNLSGLYKKYNRRLTTEELKIESTRNEDIPTLTTCIRYLRVTSIKSMWDIVEEHMTKKIEIKE